MALTNPTARLTPETALPPTRMMLSFLHRAALLLKRDPDAAMTFIEQASDLIEGQQHIRPGVSRGRLTAAQARKVADYIEENLHRPLRVEELAALAGQSVGHFSTTFRQTFGMPPHANIQERRVERAKRMLELGSASLCDIAIECGLADQAHLSRVFRKYTGSPPGAWRRRR